MQIRGTRLPAVAIVDFDQTGIDSNARAMQYRGMSNERRAKSLRTSINFLARELELCRTYAERRCVKQAIRSLELELTEIGQ